MNLAINGIRLSGERFGVGRYVEYLLRCWERMDLPFERVRLYTPDELDTSFTSPDFVEHRVLHSSLPRSYWEQVVLPRARTPDELLFCPSYVAPLFGRGRIVVTHLGSYESLPSAFPLHVRMKTRLLYGLSARRANLVITVSESSKADIVKHYGITPRKIVVIPLGVDPKFRPLDDETRKAAVQARYFGSARPFVLFVGKLSKRRNIPELIAAFQHLKQSRSLPHGLLLVGRDTGRQKPLEIAGSLGVADWVRHVDYEDHDALVEIYNAADLFVYPSSYEGFGIPVLEAMACGLPAVTLRNSAFPEFASGAYMCEHASAHELSRAMEVVLLSPELRDSLRREGVSRSRDFRWDGIARRTLDALAAAGES